MKRINRLYIVRHGQIVGHEKQPIFGHTDVDITEVGKLQMERVAEKLRYDDIKAIYSSDLQRSEKGAKIISRFHDVELRALPDLKEVYFGDWEGMTFLEVIERFRDELDKRMIDLITFRYPGGESMKQFAERVMSCVERIKKEHKGEDVLIVGHGAVNRVILCDALGLDLKNMFNIHQDYGCLNIIDYFPDFKQVKLING